MAIEPTLTASMDCGDLERAIDAYLDGEFDARERAEADAHLAKCDRCRALADAQARIRSAIRAKLREAMTPPASAGRAPAALRARVEYALAHPRRPLWRRALSPVPVGALAACAAGVVLVLVTHYVDYDRTGRGGGDALVEEAVRNHHRDLPLEIVRGPSVAEASIPAWFAGKLDFNPAPPRFRASGVHVVGARFSHLRERDAAYYRYELPRGKAGLFIVEDSGGRFREVGREVRVGDHVVRLLNARGYNVAVWRENEIVYSLVSDLDETALFDLVKSLH